MYKLATTILVLIFFLFSFKIAGATGTCRWVVSDRSDFPSICAPAEAHTCQGDLVPSLLDCAGFPQSECSGRTADCITIEESTAQAEDIFSKISVDEEATEDPVLIGVEHPNRPMTPFEKTLSDIQARALPSFLFKDATIGGVVQAFLPWVFALAGILLFLYLLYGGFHLMISGGEPKVVQEAKGKITNALIGFVIIFTAYWIVQIVASVLGLKPITNIFG